MWLGRTAVESRGALASPAMTTLSTGVGQATLVLAWSCGDGTVYMASGMEQNGVISALSYSVDPPGNNGYAAAYINKQYNIVLLYGVENLDPQNVIGFVHQD